MAHNESELDMRQPSQDFPEDGGKERMEVRYYNRLEKMERWRREYEHSKEMEERLAAVSKLDFVPQDYTPLLERVPFKEPPIPNFDHLLEEARIATENRYFTAIASKVGILLALLIILFVVSNIIFVALAGALAAVVSVWFYFTIQDRSRALTVAFAEAKEEIARRTQLELEMIEEARAQHEQDEDERISATERLLAGEPDAIMLRLYESFPRVGFPFSLDIDIDLDMHDNIPLIKVWLPPKSVISRQTCSLTNSGRISYEDKEARQINKQYLELCAAVMMRIIASIYENIPVFDRGYANGIVRDTMDDYCVLSMRFDRQDVVKACRASTALLALQMAQVVFDTDAVLSLMPVQPGWPEEWEGVEQQMLRSAKFKIR